MVQRLENSVALRISRGCMQQVRTSRVAAWISVGPKLCVLHGDGQCCAAGWCRRWVHPDVCLSWSAACGMLYSIWLFAWTVSLFDLKIEGGAGSSMALWPCLDGFTAAVTILGVNPVNLLPKCLPVCSTGQTRSCANLPWHMIARNGFQLWTYVPCVMELRTNTVLFTWPGCEISLPPGKPFCFAVLGEFDCSSRQIWSVFVGVVGHSESFDVFWHHFCAQMSKLVAVESIHRFAYGLMSLHVARYYVGRTAFNRWQGAARSVWLRTSQLLAAVTAILPFRVSVVTGNCTTGDGVFTVGWKHVGLTVFLVFLAWAWAYWHVTYTEMCWRSETMVLFLLLNWIYDVTLIFFLNPQRNSAAIEESLLSCAGGDWLGVIWPNSPARLLSKRDYWCWNYWSVHLSNRRALPVWF